jgi:hypothetical protein
MKKLKALLAVLTLSCLLAASARADGTMTTGGGAPPPPRTTSYAEEVDPDPEDADALAITEPEDASSPLEIMREAVLQIACWIIW